MDRRQRFAPGRRRTLDRVTDHLFFSKPSLTETNRRWDTATSQFNRAFDDRRIPSNWTILEIAGRESQLKTLAAEMAIARWALLLTRATRLPDRMDGIERCWLGTPRGWLADPSNTKDPPKLVVWTDPQSFEPSVTRLFAELGCLVLEHLPEERRIRRLLSIPGSRRLVA